MKNLLFKISQQKYFPAIFTTFLFLFASVQPVFAAFDATSQATGVLKFIALIILVAAAIGALRMLAGGYIMQAIVVVIAASLLYFLLSDVQAIKNIGDGINNLLFGGGSSEVTGD